MGKLTLVVPTIVVSFFCVLLKAKEIHVNIICDELLYPSCVKQVTKLNQTYIPSVISDDLYSLKYDLKEGSDNLILNYQNFNITNDWWNIFLVFGNEHNSERCINCCHLLPSAYISVRHFVLETHCKYI